MDPAQSRLMDPARSRLMVTVQFIPDDRGLDPLVPRPLDLPLVLDLACPDWVAMDEAKIFAAPDDPADWPRWREVLTQWRSGVPQRHLIDRERYARPGGRWTQRCYAVAQVWLWDELLYDFATARFTPDRLLADAHERFGGFDGVVLWHAYPVIGIDERNQWDFYRDVPGLAQLVTALQTAGIAVFLDYNPWDTGTRRGGRDQDELPQLIGELGADGVFLDTLKHGDPELVSALEAAQPGIGLEGESTLPLAGIAEHRLSWAQWFADSAVPGVLRTHFLERRHMQHHTRRWHRSHAEELQSAFLNGVGVMVWEVVFGVWVGWSERDAATLRRLLAIQRAAADLLVRGEWTPLAPLHPAAHRAQVFSSAFVLDGVTLHALVNRSDQPYAGPVLERADRTVTLLPSPVPARGIGAVVTLAAGVPEPGWLTPLVGLLGGLSIEDDATFPYRAASLVVPAPSTGTPIGDHVRVHAGSHRLTVRYRARETGLYDEAPFVDEWKPLPPRLHDRRTVERVVDLDHPVAVAVREVTNADYRRFVSVTGYTPATANRFLAHVEVEPAEEAPVTFVDLGDARAYAGWVGARLPTEDEWQLAGVLAGRAWTGAPRVWNWTESEHTDGRTRYVQLKGGSDHYPVGSEWYFDGGPQAPDFTAKLLLPGLGLARSSQIGFRLAWDLPEEQE